MKHCWWLRQSKFRFPIITSLPQPRPSSDSGSAGIIIWYCTIDCSAYTIICIYTEQSDEIEHEKAKCWAKSRYSTYFTLITIVLLRAVISPAFRSPQLDAVIPTQSPISPTKHPLLPIHAWSVHQYGTYYYRSVVSYSPACSLADDSLPVYSSGKCPGIPKRANDNRLAAKVFADLFSTD